MQDSTSPRPASSVRAHFAGLWSGLRQPWDVGGGPDQPMSGPLGLRFVPMLVGGAVAVSIALVVAGLPWIMSVLCTSIATLLCYFAARNAWRCPERYSSWGLLRNAVRGFVLAYGGSMIGCLTADLLSNGDFDGPRLAASLADWTRRVAPVMALIVITVIALMGCVSWVKRVRTQRELALLRAVQERDAAARQLAEARLKLLQGQIQPHFIFNTLAAIQHWVDESDPRSGPLLRALTAFLRGSTELLNQDRTPLATEVGNVRHYLDIMTARFGDRLRAEIAIDPRAGEQPVPPGLLLTLVENAIEHGIAPALHGGTLHIRADQDARAWTLTVDNGGIPLAPGSVDGIGLANCRERLKHLFGPRATLSVEARDGRTVAIVRIERE